MFRVYCATSKTSGKSYVGVTGRTVKWRWCTHVSSSRTAPKYKFHRAISKYGSSDFEVVELHAYSTRAEAELAEETLIAILDLVAAGYNTSGSARGGPHHGNVGRVRSAETRAKISASKKGRPIKQPPMSEEHLQKIRDRLRSKSPETLAKIAATKRGVSYGPSARQNMARGQVARRAREAHIRLNAEYGVAL